MDIEIKYEPGNTLCHGCLSAERKVERLNKEFSKIFFQLRNDRKRDRYGVLQLCWECVAFLKKLKKYKARFKTAQTILLQYLQSYYNQDGLEKPQCLTPLSGMRIEKLDCNFYAEQKLINEELAHTIGKQEIFNVELKHINEHSNHFNDKQKVINEELNEINVKQNVIHEEVDHINDKNKVFLEELNNFNKQTRIQNELNEINDEQKVFHEELNHINEGSNHTNDKLREYHEPNKILLEEFTDIKLECNDKIKEEYSNDNDTEFYETDFKLENGDDNGKLPKQKRKRNPENVQSYYRKKYEKYFTLKKYKDKFKNKFIEYSELVHLSYNDYENVVRKDRYCFGYPQMPFKCKECAIGYRKKLDLLRHMSFCHNKTPFPYKCSACTETITSMEHLDQHWMNSHTLMLKCTLCSEICRSNGEIRKHLNRKHTRSFNCNECTLEFGLLREFIKHYKSAHETVVCDYCNMNFTKKRSLAAHIKRFHLPAYCNICKRTYSNHKTFKYHNQVTHPELIAGETRKELSYCVECDKQYPSVYKYHRHLQLSPRHTPQKKLRVPCPDCGKVFTRTNFMKNHYRFAHLKVTKNYCEQCDKYYTTGYGLRTHIERVHKKIAQPKDKICDLCGRGFGTNKVLINHRRTHTGERPHKCQYCPAAFAQETAMKTHQKTQHKNISLEQPR